MKTFDTTALAPTQRRETRTVGMVIAELFALFSNYREMRKARKPRPFYHNHKEQNLERARQDVNRLWQHHF